MRSYSHSSASRSPFTCFAMSARGSAAVATGRRATIMSAICAMVPTTMSRDGAVPMKTIVVSLLKGGVGKTFLATHLRSEEHTSELQSLMRNSYAVFCLKKKIIHNHKTSEIQKCRHI